MGPDAIVLAAGCLENIEGQLVAEANAPLVLDRPVLGGHWRIPAAEDSHSGRDY